MIGEVTHSQAFSKAVKVSFNKVDTDKTGTLSKDELTVALCHLVFNLSKKVPGVVQMPTANEVDSFLTLHDRDGSGDLDLVEFEAFAKAWIQEHGKNFMLTLAGGLLLNFAIIPIVAKQVHQQTWITRKIPMSVIAGGLALLVKRVAIALQKT